MTHVIANVALRAYSDTEHNLKDFDYGAQVIKAEEKLIGDQERTWCKESFSGTLNDREDVWGSIYTHENKKIVSFHGTYWLAD